MDLGLSTSPRQKLHRVLFAFAQRRAPPFWRYRKFRLDEHRRFDSYRKFRLDEYRRFDSYKKFRLDEHRRFDSYKEFRLDEHRRFDGRPCNLLCGLLRRKIGLVCSNRTAVLVEPHTVFAEAQDMYVFYRCFAVASFKQAVVACSLICFSKIYAGRT